MSNNNMTFQMNAQGALNGKKIFNDFCNMCDDPRKTTENLLLKILKDNANTEYGKKYGFSNIKSLNEYKNKVPVITYNDIDNDIERIKDGEKNTLTSYNYKHLTTTSGTTGKQKAIPLTDEQNQVFMKYSNQLSFGVLANELGDEWMCGRSFSTAQGSHETLPSGLTIGSASSIIADVCIGGLEPYSSMLKSMYTSPPEAMKPGIGIDNVYMHTRFALMDKEITGITAGFISVLCSHFNYIRKNYQLLISDIEKGTIDLTIEIPDETRKSLLKRIEPMPQRATELREIFKDGANFPFISKVWPKMKYYICAGGDGFSVYDEKFKKEYAGNTLNRIYSGITASEGLWTVPYTINELSSVIVPDSAVIEFLPVEAGDDFSKIKEIDELEEGKIYELIITNLCGFYRYRMSDAVKVTGFFHKTPKVEFMYRVNKTINLACEKTTEAMLKMTVENVAKKLNFELIDYEVYPDTNVFPPQYKFLIEAPENIIERVSKEELDKAVFEELCIANKEYEECFSYNEIQKPDCWFEYPQTQLLYMDKEIYLGANASQIKPVHIISNEKQKNFFMKMINKWI